MNEELTLHEKSDACDTRAGILLAIILSSILILSGAFLILINSLRNDETIIIASEFVDTPIEYNAKNNRYNVIVTDHDNNNSLSSMSISWTAKIVYLDDNDAIPYIEYNNKNWEYTIFIPKDYKIPVVDNQ